MTQEQTPPKTEAELKPHNGPSILFASPMSILDITSGASLSMRTFLAALAERGFRAVALQATLFDSTHGGEHVLEAGEQAKGKDILRTQALGIEHIIVRTKASRRPDMTCEEQERYIKCFRLELRDRRPDMIILWGGMLLEMNIMREARELGIPVIFYLVNSGYNFKDTFRYVSAIITDSQSTADMYRERHNLLCHPIGKFIDTKLIKAPERKPDYITFINPSFEKGVNVFMPLAKLAAEECPEIKFLVVQSRGRWDVALKTLKFNATDFPNVSIIGHQRDMRKVYANTRALLLPSVWYESGARVIPEALLNGIPVVASNTGGSKELVGKAGVLFDLPEDVREKKLIPATVEVVRPWLEEIKRLWHDADYYQALCAQVDEEAKKHDIQRSVDRFLAIADPIVQDSKIAVQKVLEAKKKAAAGATVPQSTAAKDVIKAALNRKQAQQKSRNKKKAK
ncbi:MAG: glycosyltransferase family 4 protein [Gammaproteobacteria bacterium]|nr:glycosyltransferase family 4 protein [Gammaproteobacteria bacterium]MDP2139737.1 glycosyltransferase family 4 protein [Gammaproteobacteria bacterium]MDP2348940.1 glycosyltransferase family 4 protein [Gammaproteobacteria bacterium]